MRSRAQRLRCLLVLTGLTAPALPAGCGSSQMPDGAQVNVTIPREQADKQNEAYKNYAKENKRSQTPNAKQGNAYRNYSRGSQQGRPPG